MTSLIAIGPVFGYQDYFNGLAIIMDTYSNHNGPHNVSLELHLFFANINPSESL